MGKVKKQPPVKLVVGFIFKEEDVLKQAKRILIRRFGKIDFESQPLSFTYTRYYEQEMGKGLKKVFVSFKKLIPADSLPAIKTAANNTENKLTLDLSRQINIDPGYLDLAKFVLATTKDYSHRIYLSKGIYAEITLVYQEKTFRPWDWTYPDYRSHGYIEILNRIRKIYAEQVKNI